MIKIYNTLTKKKEVFTPINQDIVKIYACGPTVYDYAHIGNFRTYLMEDILNRIFKYNGLNTTYVQNITDVGHLVSDGDIGEDKMEKGARAQGKTAWEIAKIFEKAYFEDSKKLNINTPDIVARATEHIEEQIGMIMRLEKLGFTYKTSDGVYFDTNKQKDYGKLANIKKDGLKEGARVEKNPEKRNETDFALWKFSPKDKKRQMEWSSPWGVGFPGWHIECSAMSTKYLGEHFDIHAGASDLIPIHHTNEIAQNEATFGHKTVNYWVHGAFLLIDGGRMGKSLGNAYLINDIVKRGFNPIAFRYFTMTAHYRQPLNFTWKALDSAQRTYENIISKIAELLKEDEVDKNDISGAYEEKFKETINNDLNMPEAIAILHKILGDENISAKIKINTIAKFDEVFGLSLIEKALETKKISENIPKELLVLAEERDIAKKNKNWTDADQIRKKIIDLGYTIQDTAQGFKITKK